MILGIIVFTILVAGVIIWTAVWKSPEVLLALLIAILIGGGTFLISWKLYSMNASTYESLYSDEDIYTLDLSSTVEGNFVLGTGNVDTEYVYIFYIKDESNFYKLKYVEAANTKIAERDDFQPCVITKKLIPRESNWFFGVGDKLMDDRYIYEIYVPKGTLIESYNIR